MRYRCAVAHAAIFGYRHGHFVRSLIVDRILAVSVMEKRRAGIAHARPGAVMTVDTPVGGIDRHLRPSTHSGEKSGGGLTDPP